MKEKQNKDQTSQLVTPHFVSAGRAEPLHFRLPTVPGSPSLQGPEPSVN